MLVINEIGTKSGIPNWPTNDLDGLFDALERWVLDPRWVGTPGDSEPPDPHQAPFRGQAWTCCNGKFDPITRRTVYHAIAPIYPGAPAAVRYCGSFLGFAFGFSVDTDDADLIERLDSAIKANMQQDHYVSNEKLLKAQS